MYKVFVNDTLIIVTDSLETQHNFPVFIFKDLVIDELLYRIKSDSIQVAILFCDDLERDWKAFKSAFNVIKAGGGLVINPQKEILFIYRNRIWDLPKGRAEKGESIETTSLREVEEECGVQNLNLQRFLLTTYHVFHQNGERRLKETFWYLMNSEDVTNLKPQLEEGITEAVFKNENETQKALEHTYANIKLVVACYKKS